MTVECKNKILNYLKAAEEVAVAPGYAVDHATGLYTRIELIAFSDGESEWTSEDIYNFEVNNEVFDDKLFHKIIIEQGF